MHKVKSCGVLVFRNQPARSFLLMRHYNRYDLPKGHVMAGESEMQCALRELEEETSITRQQIQFVRDYRYETTYTLIDRHNSGTLEERKIEKTVVIFMAWLNQQVTILPTEHIGFEWQDWKPPHNFHQGTIDGALHAAERYLLVDPVTDETTPSITREDY